MKFSWLWLNQLVYIKDIPIDKLKQTLTLAGLEVENTELITRHNDQIIEISLTPNRLDISYMIGLAREISVLFNKTLKTKLIYNNILNNIHLKKYTLESNQNVECINSIRIKTINLSLNTSPLWMQNYLKYNDIKPTYLLQDIQEYIKIKWKYSIYILDTLNYDIYKQQINQLNNETSLIDKLKIQYISNTIIDNKYNYLLIIGILYDKKYSTFYCKSDFNNAFQELINLIQTFGKGCLLYTSPSPRDA